jgi:MFS family permease
MATSVGMLIAIRLVAGAMQANLSVANAYVADITPPEQRAKRFGMLGAMFGVGFILGPVIGGLLGSVSLRLPFYAAGCLALLNLLYGYFVLPESLPVSRRHAFAWQAANPFSALRRLGQLKDVAPLAVVVACTGLARPHRVELERGTCEQRIGLLAPLNFPVPGPGPVMGLDHGKDGSPTPFKPPSWTLCAAPAVSFGRSLAPECIDVSARRSCYLLTASRH